jgi:hypothetical protein
LIANKQIARQEEGTRAGHCRRCRRAPRDLHAPIPDEE